MKKSINRYRNLPSVSVEKSTLIPGATCCVLRSNGTDQISVMLFAQGIFAVFGIMPDPGDEIAEALARLVTQHAFRHSPPGTDLVTDIREMAADPCDALAWDDLPVRVSAPRSTGKVTCYPLRTDDCAALVLSNDDPTMPVSFVAVTDARPRRELFIAIGRSLIGHHGFLLK